MSKNTERADRAYRFALIYANEESGDGDIESAIFDLITDLVHLAEEYYSGGFEALRVADNHFRAERAGDG